MSVRRVVQAAFLFAFSGLLAHALLTHILAHTTRVGHATPRERSGVIDRIVDGAYAVILIDEEEGELVVPAADLPAGAKEGVWLTLRQEASSALSFELDPLTTAASAERIEAKLQALRSRRCRPTCP